MEKRMMDNWGLPENYVMRTVTLDDVEAVVALVNACSQAAIGKDECDVNEYRTDWQAPTLNRETDLRVVLSPTEEIVGYTGVWDQKPHVRIYGFVHVHPAHQGRGIGTSLANWVEGRARESIASPRRARRLKLASGLTERILPRRN